MLTPLKRFRSRAGVPLRLIECLVPAGFPSPADDYLENPIDLNAYVTDTPEATYLMRVSGDSMVGAHICDGDIVVVDTVIEAQPNHVVVALVDGEMTLKRLRRTNGRWILQPENRNYPPIELNESMDVTLWGVVTHVIHRLVS